MNRDCSSAKIRHSQPKCHFSFVVNFMGDIEEKLHLVKWRNSLREQLAAKKDEDKLVVSAIADLEKSTSANAEMIRSLVKQNNEAKEKLRQRAEEDEVRAQLRTSNHKLRKLKTDLEAAQSFRSQDARHPAFEIVKENPFNAASYIERLNNFELRLQGDTDELSSDEREVHCLQNEIEAVSQEVEGIRAENSRLELETPNLAELNGALVEIELFLEKRNDCERKYAKLQAKLRTVYEDAVKEAPPPRIDPKLMEKFRQKRYELESIQEQENRVNSGLKRVAESLQKLVYDERD